MFFAQAESGHCSNTTRLSQSVFMVQAVGACVLRPPTAEPCAQRAATVSDPIKHVRNQGSFKSD